MTTYDIRHGVSGESGDDELSRAALNEVETLVREVRGMVDKLPKSGGNGRNGDNVTIPKWVAIALFGAILTVGGSLVGVVINLNGKMDLVEETRFTNTDGLIMERQLRTEMQRIRDGCPTAIAERRIQALEQEHMIVSPPCVRN